MSETVRLILGLILAAILALILVRWLARDISNDMDRAFGVEKSKRPLMSGEEWGCLVVGAVLMILCAIWGVWQWTR